MDSSNRDYIKIVVTGAAGRMGSRIIDLILHDKAVRLVGAVEAPRNPSVGKVVGGIAITDSLEGVLSGSDVVIDFTLPHLTLTHLEMMARFKRAAVIGTTGHDEGQRSGIDAFAQRIPVVFASNMSVGVNVMWKLLGDVARVAGQASAIRVDETHHIHKRDKPSGTALEIKRILNEGLTQPVRVEIESKREGEVVGIHSTTFDLPQESLTIVHEAKSRDVFALGAIRAAKWVTGKRKGLYTMMDVLGLS